MENSADPERSFPNSLEDISKHFGMVRVLKSIIGPLSLREGLGISQNELAQLLQHYTHGHAYTRSTISLWERTERGVRLPARYAMTERTRIAYGVLLADVIHLASGGQYRLWKRMGPRRWRFQLEADCRDCKRPFIKHRLDAVRCQRCARKARR